MDDATVEWALERLQRSGELPVLLTLLADSAMLIDREIRAELRQSLLVDPAKQAYIVYRQGWLAALHAMQQMLSPPEAPPKPLTPQR
jgi:hypothetical protein